MNIDRRLDRAERMLLLIVNAGRRERRRSRDMDEKINILIDAQIKNEELFRKTEEEAVLRWQENYARWQENYRKLHETDRKWQELDRKWQEIDLKWQEIARKRREEQKES